MAREPEDLASIDELLAGSAEPEPDQRTGAPGRPATPGSRLARSVLVAAVLAGALYVVALPLGFSVPYLLLVAVFLALGAVRRALRSVAAPRLTIGAMPPPPAIGVDPDGSADGVSLALSRWDTRLSWTERDGPRFGSTVVPRLAEIADERLRQRHGLTRAADPRRAREIMGDRLWGFLHAPVTRAPSVRELAVVVDEMEKL
ncbi:MAG: hypothetical protein QOE03_1107 [Micromonosporaceae bacterium]|nr:hypothetical protein [Micromonosporaceae bacterium]